MNISLVSVPILSPKIPPLAIASIAGHLKLHGHQVKSIDLNIDAYNLASTDDKKYWKFCNGHLWSPENEVYEKYLIPKLINPNLGKWVQDILVNDPQIVGISTNITTISWILAKELKKNNPKLIIVIGGPPCSRVFQNGAKLPDDIIDASVSGEGEESLLELATVFEKTGKLKAVDGVTIFQDGKIIKGEDRDYIKNLDSLAFSDFKDFDLKKYEDVDDDFKQKIEIPLYSSRGCIGRCKFCVDYKIWNKTYRIKSPERVFEEINHYNKEYGANQFVFIELMLTNNHNWLKRFSTLLINDPKKIYFWTLGRINKQFNYELLKSLKNAGLFHLCFGLESGCNRTLKLMRKGYNTKTASDCIKACHKAEISVDVNLVVGFPGERFIDCIKTAIFIIRHRKFFSSQPNLSICYAIQGSDIFLYPDKFNIENDGSIVSQSEWKTKDGKNTPEIRAKWYSFYEKVFSKFKFS